MKNKFLKKGLVAMVVALSLVFVIAAFTACGNPVEDAREAFTAADGWTITNVPALPNVSEEAFTAIGPEGGSFSIITYASRTLADAAYTAAGITIAMLGEGAAAGRSGNTVWFGSANALEVWNG